MAVNPNRVRVGMIKVDPHSYFFAPRMEPAACDGVKLAHACPPAHRHVTHIYDLHPVTQGIVPRFSIDRIWDADPRKAQQFSEVFNGKPKVCGRFEEVGEDVDLVFINCCSDFGHEHLVWARPFLTAGLPVFVDKPFAFTLSDAREMVALSLAHRAPMLSASLLLLAPEAEVMRLQIKQLGGAIGGAVRGCPGWPNADGINGIIHSLSLTQAVFGEGVEAVAVYGKNLFEIMVLRYSDGREVLVNNQQFSNGYALYADAYTAHLYPNHGNVRSPRIDNASYNRAVVPLLEAVADLAVTGRPLVSHESTLELIATLEAGRKAYATGKMTPLAEV